MSNYSKNTGTIITYNPASEDIKKTIEWKASEIILYEDRLVWREDYKYRNKYPDLGEANSTEEQYHRNTTIFKRSACVSVALYYNRFPYGHWIVCVSMTGVSDQDQPLMVLEDKAEAGLLYDKLVAWIFNY